MFLRYNSLEFNSHIILSELQYSLDYAPLVVDIHITEEFIQDKWCTIIKNSKEEEEFTSDLIKAIKKIDTSYLVDKEFVKNERSGLNIFLFSFLISIFFILFLELELGVEWQDHAVTQQVTSDDMVTSHMMHGRT